MGALFIRIKVRPSLKVMKNDGTGTLLLSFLKWSNFQGGNQ